MIPLWSFLPDLCLLAIFRYLPMSDMIHSVGLVCINWARVQRRQLKHRHILVIADENVEDSLNLTNHVRGYDRSAWPSPFDQCKFHVLRVQSDDVLTEEFTSLLMDILPNITHLSLTLNVAPNWAICALEQIVRLINHYANRLTWLKLDNRINFLWNSIGVCNAIEMRVISLFESINRLESLQHLTLNINLGHLNLEPQLTILSRLFTFTTKRFQPEQLLLTSLSQYAINGDVRIDCSANLPLCKLIRLDTKLAIKFTKLQQNVELSENQYENMRLFCGRFVSLTSLSIDLGTMSLAMLAQCLSQLLRLIHLKVHFSPLTRDKRSAQPQLELTQVTSVLLLTLNIATQSHLNIEQLHIDRLFPNLQVLHLIHRPDECDLCDYDTYGDFRVMDEPEHSLRIGHCMRLARQPLRLCAHLHTIKLDTCRELSRLLPTLLTDERSEWKRGKPKQEAN